MKVEIIDDDYYKVFINGLYTKEIDINNKDELGKYVKDIILKLRKIYNIILQGLYEVRVYYIRFIGIILEISNIDKYLSKTVDLKIIVHNDEEIFLKIFRYELINHYNHLKYYNNCFYFDINDLKEEDVYRLIESTNIVYGDELEELKPKWIELT
ncbi:MAG: hypothetical protein IJO43_03720 [Bacilli bacterium]|nr:hypothetical protein [Bacilli bacterium]